VNDRVKHGARRIALVARSAGDIREVMIEGGSGILATAGANRPLYEPSKRRLTWPNGAVASTYSAEEANLLRGPEHDTAWCDELSSWSDAHRGDRLDTAWNNLMLGLRLQREGAPAPACLVTSTPKPNKLTRDLSAKDTTVITTGSTYDNLANLAGSFRDQVLSAYEGTRIGRQELSGELLDDVEGALWTLGVIESNRAVLVEG
jgi:phage terminase large subunit-like protein